MVTVTDIIYKQIHFTLIKSEIKKMSNAILNSSNIYLCIHYFVLRKMAVININFSNTLIIF